MGMGWLTLGGGLVAVRVMRLLSRRLLVWDESGVRVGKLAGFWLPGSREGCMVIVIRLRL